MTQTILSAQDHRPGSRHSKGLLLAALGIAVSLFTAVVLGGSRTAVAPTQPVAAHTTAPAATDTSGPASTTMPDAGSVPVAKDFPIQDPAPTF